MSAAVFAVRLGLDAKFTDNFTGGVEVETSENNDSANQTLGNAYGKGSINLGLAYLSWKPADWVTITAARCAIRSTPPISSGIRISIRKAARKCSTGTFPIGGGESAPATRDPKDVKDVKAIVPSGGSDESLSVGFTAFQASTPTIPEFNNSVQGGIPSPNHDVWQFVEQVPVQFNFNKSTFVKVVPGFDTYLGGGNSGPSNVPATIDAAEVRWRLRGVHGLQRGE